jgi:hypothetical protein
MEPLVLKTEMVVVFFVLGFVVILLVFNLLRVDVVGLLVMTMLPLTGLLSVKEGDSRAGFQCRYRPHLRHGNRRCT